jgi:hypothetical protein
MINRGLFCLPYKAIPMRTHINETKLYTVYTGKGKNIDIWNTFSCTWQKRRMALAALTLASVRTSPTSSTFIMEQMPGLS